MLTLTLDVKPLTVNRAWRGRHFSTPAKTQFETRLHYSLPKVAVVGKPFYRIEYDLHLVNFAARVNFRGGRLAQKPRNDDWLAD